MKGTVKTIKINYIEDGDDEDEKNNLDCGEDGDDDNVVGDCDDEANDDDYGGNMRYSARCLLGFKVRTEESTCQCIASSLLSSSSF